MNADRLEEEHTKAELRQRAYDWGLSVPRGATKRDIALMLSKERRRDVLRHRRAIVGLEPGDVVWLDGDEYEVLRTDHGRSEVELIEAGGRGRLRLNMALTGSITVFDEDDNAVADLEKVDVARRRGGF